jgi:threonine synthase
MRKLLDTLNFLVLEAANGEDGFRAAEIARPRCVVLDLGLPDIDGFSMLDRFDAARMTRDIPVVVATARDLTDAERTMLESRVFAVLSKRDMLSSIIATVAAASRDKTLSTADVK